MTLHAIRRQSVTSHTRLNYWKQINHYRHTSPQTSTVGPPCEPRRTKITRRDWAASWGLVWTSVSPDYLLSDLSHLTTLIFRPRPGRHSEWQLRPGLTDWLKIAFSGCEYLLFWSDWLTDSRPPSLTTNYTVLLLLAPTGPSLVPGTVRSQTGLVSRGGGGSSILIRTVLQTADTDYYTGIQRHKSSWINHELRSCTE